MNVDHHSLGVQVTDFQMDRFPDPQSQGVGRPDERFHSPGPAGVDDLEDLGLGDNFGQRFDVIQFGLLEHLPLSRAGGAKEELDSTEKHTLRSGSDVPLDDVVQQKRPKFRRVDLMRRFLVEVSQLADGPHVTINGSLGFARQLQVFDQFAVPISFEILAGCW